MPLFLCRYAEIGLKSEHIRRRFENILAENVQKHFIFRGKECLVSWSRGRLFVMSSDEAAARDALSHTFGIVSFSQAVEVGCDMASVLSGLQSYAGPLLLPGRSFALRVRRAGNHPFTSMDLAREGGAMLMSLFQQRGIRVDLEHPDVEIFVEVRENAAYIYSEMQEGPGGLPLGSQGRVLCQMQNEEDMLAAWLVMRRGCRVVVSGDAYVSQLRKWDPELPVVEPGDAVALAIENGCNGIVYGGLKPGLKKYSGLAYLFPTVMLSAKERRELLGRIVS